MIRSFRLGRLALACTVLLSAVAIGVAPAGAVPGPSGSAVGNNGTATLTYANTTTVVVYIIDGASICENTGYAPTTGVIATLGVDTPMPPSPVTITTESQVGPLPLHALGTGSFMFCMYDITEGYEYLNVENGTIGIYPPASASMVDNGNGTLTLTWNANTDFSQFVAFALFTGITSCPADPASEATSLSGYLLQTGAEDFGAGMPPSPAVISVGLPAFVLPYTFVDIFTPPTVAPMAAGQYLACVYIGDSEDPVLAQSMPMGLGIVPEPVVPAFTG